MPIEPQDVAQLLAERQASAERVLDSFGTQKETYRDFQKRIALIDDVYRGNWKVIWPDDKQSDGLPKIPNLVQLAAEDRARVVAGGNPSIICRPEEVSDEAKAASEKRERIIAGYWTNNNIRLAIPRWAHDAMAAGVALCKVLPDYTKPEKERLPLMRRVDPRQAFPSPVFTNGPFIDDILISYEEDWRVLAKRYDNVDLASLMVGRRPNQNKVNCIEYHDDKVSAVMAAHIKPSPGQKRPGYTWLVPPTPHGLSRCPVTLGVRPSMDGIYRGDFDSVLAVLNVWNRLMNLHLDAATQRVYPATLDFDIENPEEWGPDAALHAESQQARFEFIQPPGAAYENHQLMNLLANFARAGALMPDARSGDPQQSIISAAGITASGAQMIDHVRSLQRDTISPMLQAANEIALEADEVSSNVTKVVFGYNKGQAFRESYKPSKDIDGNYRNQVVYGLSAGDPINTNVMVLQQKGAGLISTQTAMEQSPFVDDPTEEAKRIAAEQVDQAVFAGLIANANAGALDPMVLANIRKSLETVGTSLHDAIIANLPAAPLAVPPGMGPQGITPGIPGAARGQQPEQPRPAPLPPLSRILAGVRPGR